MSRLTSPHLLLINPNTTHAITGRMAELGRGLLPDVRISAVNGRFGCAYISSRASFAVAGHAALDCFAEHGAGADAVLLACFGDPGLDALREVASVPVIGLVEAACHEAMAGGRPYAIVTGGERWGPMLAEMAAQRGLGRGLVRILTVAPTGGQIADDPDGALQMLAESCRACVTDGAEAVILGGAGLIGLAARVAPIVGRPVICSVEAGFRAAQAALQAVRGQGSNAPAGSTVATPSLGLSTPLAALFAQGRMP
jgi:allantoin racemase